MPVIKNVGDFLKVMVDLELNRDIWHKKWMVPTHNPDLKSVSWLAKIPSLPTAYEMLISLEVRSNDSLHILMLKACRNVYFCRKVCCVPTPLQATACISFTPFWKSIFLLSRSLFQKTLSLCMFSTFRVVMMAGHPVRK